MKPFWKAVCGGCLGTAIAFILVNIVLFSIIASALSSLGSKKDEIPSVPKNAILKIDFKQAVTEKGGEDFDFGPLAGLNVSESMSLLDAVRAIDAAASDPQIRFIYVKPDMLNVELSHVEELRAALVRFRESGKPVVSYSQSLSVGSYYLASVADKVILNSYADVTISGLGSQVMYYKDLIDHLGVDVQLIRLGI